MTAPSPWSTGAFEHPCAAKPEFSPAETLRRRASHPGECCYLTHCQISYGD